MQPLRNRLGSVFVPWAAIVSLAVLAQPANAQLSSAEQNALRSNCRSDFMSHCSSESPGTKGALVCLQKNVASLSPGCKAAVSATLPPPPAAKAAPPPMEPKPKPAVVAAPPKAEPPPRSAAQSDALNAACGNDYLAHCASVAPGGKEALVCLRQHAMELSVPCKRVLSEMVEPQRPAPPKRAVRVAPPPVVVVAPPPAAMPAAAGPTPQQMKALKFTCRRDFRAYCRGVPEGPEAFACLMRNSPRLSPNCRTSVADIAQSVPAGAAPPPPAAAIPPPAVPIARIESMGMRERLEVFRACERDQAVVCPRVDPGGGRLIICLASHPQALSRRCGRALQRALY